MTNNQIKYEAMLKGLHILRESRADVVEIFGNSLLIIYQLLGIYECKDDLLQEYFNDWKQILEGFGIVSLHHTPREQNEDANRLAQLASGSSRRLEKGDN